MWYLEVEKPGAVGRIQLLSSSVDYLKMGWNQVSCVEYYILQIQRTEIPLFKTRLLEDSPKDNFASLATQQTHSPPQISLPKQMPPNVLPHLTSESVTNVPPVGVSSGSNDMKPQSLPTIPYRTEASSDHQQLSCPIPTADSLTTSTPPPVPAKTTHLPPQNTPQQLVVQAPKPVTTTAPIIITIPTSLSEQMLPKPSNPVLVSNSFKTVTTVANGNKPAYTITSMSKPISSHVPVATMPLHPRTQGSTVRFPPQSIANHHSSVKSLPYLPSPTSRSHLNNAPSKWSI